MTICLRTRESLLHSGTHIDTKIIDGRHSVCEHGLDINCYIHDYNRSSKFPKTLEET